MSSEILRKQREQLMKELRDLGYANRMKYNGEVLVENVEEANLVQTKKNGKLMIRVKNKQDVENRKEEDP